MHLLINDLVTMERRGHMVYVSLRNIQIQNNTIIETVKSHDKIYKLGGSRNIPSRLIKPEVSASMTGHLACKQSLLYARFNPVAFFFAGK